MKENGKGRNQNGRRGWTVRWRNERSGMGRYDEGREGEDIIRMRRRKDGRKGRRGMEKERNSLYRAIYSKQQQTEKEGEKERKRYQINEVHPLRYTKKNAD